MVVYIAAIGASPSDYYEAADLEGATRWQKFKDITFPMIAPGSHYQLHLAPGLGHEGV